MGRSIGQLFGYKSLCALLSYTAIIMMKKKPTKHTHSLSKHIFSQLNSVSVCWESMNSPKNIPTSHAPTIAFPLLCYIALFTTLYILCGTILYIAQKSNNHVWLWYFEFHLHRTTCSQRHCSGRGRNNYWTHLYTSPWNEFALLNYLLVLVDVIVYENPLSSNRGGGDH